MARTTLNFMRFDDDPGDADGGEGTGDGGEGGVGALMGSIRWIVRGLRLPPRLSITHGCSRRLWHCSRYSESSGNVQDDCNFTLLAAASSATAPIAPDGNHALREYPSGRATQPPMFATSWCVLYTRQ